jgi:hypothetical protein
MKRIQNLLPVVAVFMVLSGHSVTAQTIDKSSVQIRLQVHKGFKGDPENWSWTPVVDFRVNGPFSPGGAVSVEYSLPAKTWKFDCKVDTAGIGWLGARIAD